MLRLRCPNRGGGGQLAGGEDHLVSRVVAVPAGDQFFGGLANVLTVADAAGEYAGDIQPAGESDVWAEEGKARFAMIFPLRSRAFSCMLALTSGENPADKSNEQRSKSTDQNQ